MNPRSRLAGSYSAPVLPSTILGVDPPGIGQAETLHPQLSRGPLFAACSVVVCNPAVSAAAPQLPGRQRVSDAGHDSTR